MPLLMRYESWTCWWANKSTEYFHVNYCNYFTVIEQFWLWDCVYKYISSILLQCPCLFILHLPAMLRFDKRKICVAKPMTTKIEISNLDRMKIESRSKVMKSPYRGRFFFFNFMCFIVCSSSTYVNNWTHHDDVRKAWQKCEGKREFNLRWWTYLLQSKREVKKAT